MILYRDTLSCDESQLRHRGKNMNRATVYPHSPFRNPLNIIESCLNKMNTSTLPYFYQSRTQCPIKCATGTLMNVQQSSKSRFTVQENLSTQHGVCTSPSLSHTVSQHKASRGTYNHLDSLFILLKDILMI